MSRCYPVTVVTAPQKLFLIEAAEMIDGEPAFGWQWDEGTGGLCLAYPLDRTPMGQTEKRKSTAANMTGADQ
jgi:hypothetical protein